MKRATDQGWHGFNPEDPDSPFGTPTGGSSAPESRGETPPCELSQTEFDFIDLDKTLLPDRPGPSTTPMGGGRKNNTPGKGSNLPKRATPAKSTSGTTATTPTVIPTMASGGNSGPRSARPHKSSESAKYESTTGARRGHG
jgi:hypothetical protein